MTKTIYLANPYGFSHPAEGHAPAPVDSSTGGDGAGGLGTLRTEQPDGLRYARAGIPHRPAGPPRRGGAGRHLRRRKRRPPARK
jgi:hypothetical protein